MRQFQVDIDDVRRLAVFLLQQSKDRIDVSLIIPEYHAVVDQGCCTVSDALDVVALTLSSCSRAYTYYILYNIKYIYKYDIYNIKVKLYIIYYIY
jgi:hypothetical protein